MDKLTVSNVAIDALTKEENRLVAQVVKLSDQLANVQLQLKNVRVSISVLGEWATGRYDVSQGVWAEIVKVGTEEGKLNAIKVYKNLTNSTLMQAKQAVEDYFLANGYRFKQFGC